MCIAPRLDQKRQLWKDLKDILACIDTEAICVLGDFNCIRSASEKQNCEYRRIDMAEFNELLSDCNLLDIVPCNTNLHGLVLMGRRVDWTEY